MAWQFERRGAGEGRVFPICILPWSEAHWRRIRQPMAELGIQAKSRGRKQLMKRIACGVAALLLLAGVARAEDSAADGWINLFNGKDLTGWKANENPEQWKVEDGAIVAHGKRSHLFYVGDDPNSPPEFKNFDFKAELMTEPKANSGIYFHTKWQNDGWPQIGYECQVNTTHKDPVKTASLYNVEKNFTAPSSDNEWFTEEIIVEGKHIVTKVNGKTIVDYIEPDNLERKTPRLSQGTFALQAHDPDSVVRYRKITVKKLP
jgi:hypothetical protein